MSANMKMALLNPVPSSSINDDPGPTSLTNANCFKKASAVTAWSLNPFSLNVDKPPAANVSLIAAICFCNISFLFNAVKLAIAVASTTKS